MSSPGLNGLGTPFLAGWAGFLITMILQRPGIWNAPVPFLPSALPISAVRASKTAEISFFERFVAVAMFANTSDLPAALGLGFLDIGCHPSLRGSSRDRKNVNCPCHFNGLAAN